ncbi:MAG: nucleotide exchange factor GrpE [Alphaproteobacteria bacterium]|nr:nucleotide exchange factor GrpE [Alphaproteobacteria bacterium]MCZ6496807.1 nucleotide exchange factor GrpE [Alphaproteobacteria bacterium]MCZ6610834.1 nucleotide exchange factor GrpE [Alphaproteobacteria bacterium]MCZ6847398.1 nucleotide exchange factor GrpE [Alphaproteobacteria bacterium]
MTKEEDQIPADGEEDKALEPAAERPEPASDEAPEPAGEEAEADYQALANELNDKLLRAVAELENYRRRAEKERQDTAKFAIAGFARDCLTVLDNLRRGLDSVSAEERDGNPALAALAAGMELTERELIATLERHGIEKLDPLGAPFDYDRHQAMFEVDDKSRPAGTVVEVVQPGYLLNQRLLRPAMVGVAKGGAKPKTVQAPIANEDLAAGPNKVPDKAAHVKPARQARDGAGEGAGTDGGPGEPDGHVDTKA